MHISSSYAKILGETNFHPREFPRSRSKAKDGEKKEKERENESVGDWGASPQPLALCARSWGGFTPATCSLFNA